MLKSVIGAVTLAGLATCAFAEQNDQATNEANSAIDWTGFYVGGQIGRAFSKYTVDEDNVGALPYNSFSSSTSRDVDGWIGGIHAGARYQFHNLVIGAEGEFNFIDLSDDALGLNTVDTRSIIDTKTLASIRATAGVSAGKFLLYGTAGKSYLRGNFGVLDTNPVPPSANTMDSRTDKTLDGYVYGGGIEFMAYDDWSVKVEYLRNDFDDFVTSGVAGLGGTENWEHTLQFDTVTFKATKNF